MQLSVFALEAVLQSTLRRIYNTYTLEMFVPRGRAGSMRYDAFATKVDDI